MIKMYRTRAFTTPIIEEVEVLRVTESSVFRPSNIKKEQREARQTEWQCYFPTWQEAHDYLMKSAESEIVAARRQLERAQGKLGNIKGMKAPIAASQPKEKAE